MDISDMFNKLINDHKKFTVHILRDCGGHAVTNGYLNVTIQINEDKISIPPYEKVISISEWEFDFDDHATHLVTMHPKGYDMPEIQIHR